MNIGIDATFLARDKRGMGRVTRSLIERFFGLSNHSFYFIMVKFRSDERSIRSLFPGQELQFISPRDAKVNSLDVIWFPWNRTDFLPQCRRVVSIHDLVPFRYFKSRKGSEGYRDRKRIKLASEAADKIITPSEFSKDEICTFLEIPGHKIEVIPHGVDECFCKCEIDKEKEASMLDRFSKGLPFILFVGNVEKRKNVEILINAFGDAKKNYTFPHKLIIAGKCPGVLSTGNGSGGIAGILNRIGISKRLKKNRLLSLMEKLAVSDDVIWLGEVNDDDLAWLYKLARLFVFPSYYEGFGLPVLEAMACGVPSIVSQISSVEEVAGDAAVYFDAKNYLELSEKIWQVLSDADLSKRLEKMGLERSNQFSWDTSAQKVLKVLEDH